MSRVFAWALYDLANTFFAVAMISFYFPLWLVEDRGAKELWFSVALGVSMAAVALIMPLCGALSDLAGRRMPYLRWTTYGCAIATLLIGMTSHVPLALGLFAFANMCYQLGTVFYDALLWSVAPKDRLGQASGIGAAFGYLGAMMGLLLLWPFVKAGGYHAAFAPSAAFFLLFALPSFLLIREQGGTPSRVSWSALLRAAALRLAISLRSARTIPGLWRYCWAVFFSLSAINTVLVFMGVYATKVMGLTAQRLIQFFVVTQACSIVGSLVFAWVIGRWGAKRTLIAVWLGWLGALAAAATVSSMSWLWIAGPVMGLCLGATWSTSRVMLLQLAPKDQLAEMFGLVGLFNRASTIVGPLLWGLIVWDPARYRHAVWMLVGFLAIGIWLLRRVPQPATVSS